MTEWACGISCALVVCLASWVQQSRDNTSMSHLGSLWRTKLRHRSLKNRAEWAALNNAIPEA